MSVGTGPYPATFIHDLTLANHTIYQPKVIPEGVQMPVIVWGNGGCINVGTIMFPFLIQLASQGVVVIANGAPGNVTASFGDYASAAQDSSYDLTDAINWAVANAGKGNYTHMTTSKLLAAGQSCGGVETEYIVGDPRVTSVGIFNSGSGLISPVANFTGLAKPMFFFLGGTTDIAYAQGEMDYANLPDTVPSWLGNFPVGHAGTYNDVNGGEIGVAASYMVNWLLQGNTTASSFFTDNSVSAAEGWNATSKNLDKIVL